MAEPDLAAWRVLWRRPIRGGPDLEARIRPDGGAMALVWPARLPPRPDHPQLPARAELADRTVEWVEPGALLEALDLSSDHPGWADALAGAAAALAALHDAGVAHGDLGPSRIWVTTGGALQVVGAGLEPGSVAADRAALAALAPQGPAPSETLPRDAWRDLARRARRAVRSSDPDALEEPTESVLAWGMEHTPVHPAPEGRLDEVGATLGPDDGRGLLDDPGESTGWSDHTMPGEPTGIVTAAGQQAHRRMAALVRLADGEPPGIDPGALARIEGRPLPGLADVLSRSPRLVPPLPALSPRPGPPAPPLAAAPAATPPAPAPDATPATAAPERSRPWRGAERGYSHVRTDQSRPPHTSRLHHGRGRRLQHQDGTQIPRPLQDPRPRPHPLPRHPDDRRRQIVPTGQRPACRRHNESGRADAFPTK